MSKQNNDNQTELELIKAPIGSKVQVKGHEAIARGAFEAGVMVASGFPGVPTSDILKSLKLLYEQGSESHYHLDLEWSVNQKVGFEIALSGSMSNARSMAAMKHIGINVAADAFMTACYAGALGGLVFVSIDDPSMRTSENEQDNRYYGLHGLVPVFQPSTVGELKEMLKFAFDFSEKFESLVLFNTTLRLIEQEGEIEIGEVYSEPRQTKFTEEYRARWTHLPTNARVNRVKLLERLEKISQYAEEFPFNEIKKGKGDIGVVTSGICHQFTMQALSELRAKSKVSVFKLGMAYPYPREKLVSFMKNLKTLVVIEELEPIFEEYLKSLAYEEELDMKIIGKDVFPEAFEYTPNMIKKVLGDLLKGKKPAKIPARIPDFHKTAEKNRETSKYQLQELFYKAAAAVEKKHGYKFIYTGDFGVEHFHKETMGLVNTFISQGASVGFANGIAKLEKGTVISFLNNNSFYHSGYYGLINAVYNGNDMIMVFVNELGESAKKLDNVELSDSSEYLKWQPTTEEELKKMIMGMGVHEENIFITPVEQKNIEEAFEKAATKQGVRVIISI